MLTPDLLTDPVLLTRTLVDIPSVSGDEENIAKQVTAALADSHLEVNRSGNTVMARTNLGREHRIVLAGHLDTVPHADNFPSRVEGELMWGCGTSDMKSGTAIALHLAATVLEPVYDVTYFFYDCEEVEAGRNGLNRVAREHPEWLAADFAVLLEPTHGLIEAGCQGTLRVGVRVPGRRAHSARSWLGVNAIHAAGVALRRLDEYEARRVTIDGCEYREGLSAVEISGGVAGNVIPDESVITVNFRFAPDRSEQQAADHVREVFNGFDITLLDSAPGALPGLTGPVAEKFLAAVGSVPRAKLGWTDVARFAGLEVPAANFGPGDPNLAHTREEHVEIAKIVEGANVLRTWLTKGNS
ncbi:MAG: succinyl-diaminopimelate desuccinylase [Longispora sp.]|nr:succinyl-diaminopimelate desuccinylase [Longispora sp. (in: high G+C Gram-positive bacteria)]